MTFSVLRSEMEIFQYREQDMGRVWSQKTTKGNWSWAEHVGFCAVAEVGTDWMDKQKQVRGQALPGQGSTAAAQHIKSGFLAD